jgi:hypothetical protein
VKKRKTNEDGDAGIGKGRQSRKDDQKSWAVDGIAEL